MKRIFLLFPSLLAAQVAVAAPANTDCYVNASRLQLMHGCIYLQGPGHGACETWQREGSLFHAPLTLTSPNHYELSNPELGLEARVIFDGAQHARITLRAPHVNQTRTVGVSYDSYDTAHNIPDASYSVDQTNWWDGTGLSYDVNCSFGLSDAVNAIEKAERAEMDALGPPQEWSDPTAPSVQQLPVGTVLELTQDMDIIPGSDLGRTFFVEQNGLVSETEFGALKLQYRFAYAEFFNANNSYLERTHYPKGMRLEVTKVDSETYASGGHHFSLALKLLSLPAGYTSAIDPIVRMELVGRRSGDGDLKIPQLADLLRPAIRLELPH